MSTVTLPLTVDELKILLALNGNQRIHHLESIIFADVNLVCIYLQQLLYQAQIDNILPLWINNTLHIISPVGDAIHFAIYNLSVSAFKQRWLVAEERISENIYWAKRYNESFKI